MLPAPLLAAKFAGTAKLVPIVHPGDTAPERRHIPSAVLAWFIRCRDMTCRFPGCDEPAHHCDVDHTIAYPARPHPGVEPQMSMPKTPLTQNLLGLATTNKNLTAPRYGPVPHGQTYTTHPGSRLLFPTLCRPTAPVTTAATSTTLNEAARALAMPRRTTTRTQNRTQAINDERKLNADIVAERAKPPPF